MINKRRTIAVIVSFLAVWLAIGAVVGLFFEAFYHSSAHDGYPAASSTAYGWSPVIIGVVICAFLAVLAIVYSLTSGAALVLRASGAVPADPAEYPQVHNLVESLAIGEGLPKPAVYVIDDPSRRRVDSVDADELSALVDSARRVRVIGGTGSITHPNPRAKWLLGLTGAPRLVVMSAERPTRGAA